MHWPAVVLATCGLATATITGSLSLAISRRHIPPWLSTPPISFGGALYPERFVYVAGFGLTTCAFMWMAGHFVERLGRHVSSRESSRSLALSLRLAVAAFYALFAQAAVPMAGEVLTDMATAPATATAAGAQQTTWLRQPAWSRAWVMTTVHQVSAVAFFLLALAHAVVMLRLYARDPALPVGCGAASWRGVWWWRVRVGIFVAALVPCGVWPLLHPASLDQRDAMRQRVALGGVIQWCAVGAIIGYFACYARDFAVLAEPAVRAMERKRESEDSEGAGIRVAMVGARAPGTGGTGGFAVGSPAASVAGVR